ncbi:MAG: AMP-binding protein [Pikeienuella sp.]
MSIQPPKGTVRDWIDHRAAETPNVISHIFADEGGVALTWADLRDAVRGVSERLAGLGAEKGESIAICLPNGRMGITCLFGTLYGGFRATPLNLAAGAAAMGYAITHSRARFALVGTAQSELFQDALTAEPADITTIPVGSEINWPTTQMAELAEVNTRDHALLMYTSGTTGRPKGVVHDQASLLAGGWTPTIAHELTATDRALCVLPFYHINGLCVTLMGPLVSGGSVIVAEKFSLSRFWRHCRDHGATWFSVVPTIISHLLHGPENPDEATRARLRFARSASAPLAVETQTAFEERFNIPIVETMGLTETAAQMLSNPLPPAMRKVGSPGVAIGNETTILNDGAIAPANVAGEIAVRGPNVMKEYLFNEDATRETFTNDGWLLTGDLGVMDEDGYVFVTGRRKELIIKGGENIAPREIDEALYHHKDVVEAAAFARPCPSYGQRVEAAVRLADGVHVSEADLIALCVHHVGAFKAPDRVHIMAELPKGPSGKIQRLKLAEVLLANA